MKGRKGLLSALLVLFCAVFLISGFMLGREILQRWQAQREFEELAELVTQTPAPAPTPVPSEPAQSDPSLEEPEVTPTPRPKQKRNIALLQELNSHCVGWVHIPGTNVNYPVMHTPAVSQYYLRLDFQQRYSISGTPFLDYRCTLESENLVIYGHNMTDGSMFADILNFLDEEYRQAHPIIEFETAEECGYYQVVDVRRVNADDGWYFSGFAPGEKQYLTLSTCDETGGDKRVIVIAYRTE